MTIGVSFATPAPGTSVGNTFTVTGTWVDDGQVDNQGHDQFSILQILVDFGANRFPKVKATVGDGTWSATGSLPAGVRHGDVITLAFSADILAISSSGDQPGSYNVTDTRQVIVEQTPPEVSIDAFPNDRAVDRLPFRLPLLSGQAGDVAGVTSVQFTIDGGPRQNMGSVTGGPAQVAWSVANLDFGAGKHTVTVIATDAFGNEGTASAPLTVRLNTQPPPPPPPRSGDIVFSPTFHHTNWINNVDRIEAGGPNGFNVRYDAIDSDLHRMSAVVGQIDAALQAPGVTGDQRLTPGLDFVALVAAAAGGWVYDEAGVVTPDRPDGGQAIMELVLPERITLRSFRAVGRYSGPPSFVAIRLFRSALTDQDLPPEQLAEIKLDSGAVTNPYDISEDVPAAVARVDGLFRYYVVLVANHIGLNAIVDLSALQLVYTAG